MFVAFSTAFTVVCVLGAIFAMGLTRNRFMAKTFVALAIVAVGAAMAACANACPVQQLNAHCVQQVQQVQYAPIVAPVAQAYVAPVVQQFAAPPIYTAPVFSAPVVQQFSAAYTAPVAQVAAVKSRTVTRTRPIRVPRRVVSKSTIVAPIVAPVVGY